ncbi:MAG TPA: hypothetical protein VF170_04485, partial [Planctomycetaceae bacterium]
MRRILPFAAVTVLSIVGNTASAQRSHDAHGPLLLPLGSSLGSSYSGGYDSTPYHLGGSDYRSGRHGYDDRGYSGPIRYRDSRMLRVAEWYRDFLGRDMLPVEEHNWRLHFRDGGTLEGVLAMILGGDEFYKRVGGRFEDWTAAVADATGRRVSRAEVADWRRGYREAWDRVDVRIEFVRHLLAEHAPEPVVVPDRHDHGYGRGYPVGSRHEVPWYVVEQPAHGRHDRHHGHEHTTGYRPAPASDAELIAGWYRTYFGREIAPHELRKWLSDREKGMALDEIYASVLAADEWYARAGGTPTRWIAATLGALGQEAHRDAVGYWFEHYRRRGGNRFETALDMVRATGGLPDGHDRHDHGD